jgi:phage/plasmid-associated DNA primase
MNAFPRIKDSSEAVYNRTLVLPMRVVRAERDAAPIAERIIADELPGVLNWAVEGWKRLKARGWFDPPPAMIAAGREFQGENNPLQEFVDLCIKPNPDRMVLREDFRVAFNEWLKREVQAKSEWSGKAIALAIKNGLPKVAGDVVHAGRVWVGIEFTSAALAYLDQEFGKTARDLQALNMGLPADLRERHRPKPRTVF